MECRLAAGLLCVMPVVLGAHAPGTGIATQRQAMQKLAFLVGHWSGPVTITRGPGEALRLTQFEDVQYKLDGLVMLVEGKSTRPGGKARFQALATIAYVDLTHTYQFRAYNDGHYVDSALTVLGNGFSWGFDAGPAHIVNTMHLTAQGEWQETSDVAFGNHPAQPSVQMLLRRRP